MHRHTVGTLPLRIIALFGIIGALNVSFVYAEQRALCTLSGIITNTLPGKKIYLGLAQTQEQFTTKKFFLTRRLTESHGDTASFSFVNIPEGQYLLVGYMDTNDNGIMDKGPWGVPTEPYFTLNKAASMFGPKFERDCFILTKSRTDIIIKLSHKE